MFAFEVQDLQVVALKQVVELEVVILEYWYFGQATIEISSIGLQTTNSLEVVAIGSTSFSSRIGNSKAIEIVVDCFTQHYSNQVYIVEDLGNYSFSIDFHMNLNFLECPKEYLDVGPMVGVEQQKVLAHHLHLS